MDVRHLPKTAELNWLNQIPGTIKLTISWPLAAAAVSAPPALTAAAAKPQLVHAIGHVLLSELAPACKNLAEKQSNIQNF